jgi:hypothetical protein
MKFKMVYAHMSPVFYTDDDDEEAETVVRYGHG